MTLMGTMISYTLKLLYVLLNDLHWSLVKELSGPQMGSGRNPENKYLLGFPRYEVGSFILYLVTALTELSDRKFYFLMLCN